MRHRAILLALAVGACGGASSDNESTVDDATVPRSLQTDAQTEPEPDAAPAECKTTNEICGPQAPCCEGKLCVHSMDAVAVNKCADTCFSDSSCVSGCCAKPVDADAKVCAPKEFCTTVCAMPGQLCSGPTTCCAGSTCVVDALSTSCAANCTAHWQCKSGCCAPLSNTGSFVCSPASFC